MLIYFFNQIIITFFSIAELLHILSSYSQGKKLSWLVITDVKHTHFEIVATGAAAAAVPSLYAFWEMRCCREKRGGGALHEAHHISRALITSTLLPCVLDGFSGVRSGGSALSIPPTFSMFFFSFVTAGLVLLTFCLLMQIGRCSPFSLAGSSF